jgi:ABC-type Na+ efflux pump permease subunit
MKWRRVAIAVALLALLIATEPTAAQCAMCRRALDSPEGQQLIGALRRGILVLLAAPFILFGIVAFLAVRAQLSRGHSRSEIA